MCISRCIVAQPKVKNVSISGRAGAQIPHLPWEMIHPPRGDNAVRRQAYTVYTDVCNKTLTATYQYKI
jgi:hypothetical protein